MTLSPPLPLTSLTSEKKNNLVEIFIKFYIYRKIFGETDVFKSNVMITNVLSCLYTTIFPLFSYNRSHISGENDGKGGFG